MGTQGKSSWLAVGILACGFAVLIAVMGAISWYQDEQQRPTRPASDELNLAKKPYISISGPSVRGSISNSSGLSCSYVVKVRISGTNSSGEEVSAEGSERVFVAPGDSEEFVVGVVERLGGDGMDDVEKVKLLSVDRSCSD
ncbi:hypothetical protein [Streptomyces beigongshangae]|uniref:hypothetical protein n=1 Tax=Streptomyces beigongshangae TaxID=2841597 RepID=UPI001C85EEC9|nr:hypothetical protein [Streptomyces sp. REN17]